MKNDQPVTKTQTPYTVSYTHLDVYKRQVYNTRNSSLSDHNLKLYWESKFKVSMCFTNICWDFLFTFCILSSYKHFYASGDYNENKSVGTKLNIKLVGVANSAEDTHLGWCRPSEHEPVI